MHSNGKDRLGKNFDGYMIIGIDASRALRAQRTGTEHYSLEIICHLLALPNAAEHRWRLYVDQPIPANSALATCVEQLNNQAATQAVEVSHRPARRLWTHKALAHEISNRAPDVLFVSAHVLPFVLPPHRLPPSVVTIHDLGYHFFPEAYSWQQRIYLECSTRWSALAASHVIAVSAATANDLQKFYRVEPDKISIIYEGVRPFPNADNEESALSKSLGLRPYALFLGTIQPRKNLERLLRAFAQIHQRVDFDLILAGKSSQHSDSLIEIAQNLQIEKRVHFPGYVSDKESSTLIQRAKFFCFPSLFEGFGLPVLEAQSLGVAVMTSNNSSIPEVAGEGALLVDPTDVDAIAEAMLRLSSDEALRQRLIAAGYENVKRFSWEKAARETMAVLEAAAKNKKS